MSPTLSEKVDAATQISATSGKGGEAISTKGGASSADSTAASSGAGAGEKPKMKRVKVPDNTVRKQAEKSKEKLKEVGKTAEKEKEERAPQFTQSELNLAQSNETLKAIYPLMTAGDLSKEDVALYKSRIAAAKNLIDKQMSVQMMSDAKALINIANAETDPTNASWLNAGLSMPGIAGADGGREDLTAMVPPPPTDDPREINQNMAIIAAAAQMAGLIGGIAGGDVAGGIEAGSAGSAAAAEASRKQRAEATALEKTRQQLESRAALAQGKIDADKMKTEFKVMAQQKRALVTQMTKLEIANQKRELKVMDQAIKNRELELSTNKFLTAVEREQLNQEVQALKQDFEGVKVQLRQNLAEYGGGVSMYNAGVNAQYRDNKEFKFLLGSGFNLPGSAGKTRSNAGQPAFSSAAGNATSQLLTHFKQTGDAGQAQISLNNIRKEPAVQSITSLGEKTYGVISTEIGLAENKKAIGALSRDIGNASTSLKDIQNFLLSSVNSKSSPLYKVIVDPGIATLSPEKLAKELGIVKGEIRSDKGVSSIQKSTRIFDFSRGRSSSSGHRTWGLVFSTRQGTVKRRG
jgi:hypothetical protein